MSAEEVLRDAIASGRPCVLFLGQDTYSAGTPTHSVLNRLLERKGRPDLGGWRDAIAAGLSAEDLEWLTERFERTVASESLQEALDLPWSAVFTSSVDPVLLRRLETRGRQTRGDYQQ